MSAWSVTLTVPEAERDQVIAELWEAGTTGVTEDPDWLRAFFDETADQGSILSAFSAWSPRLEQEEDRDWVLHSQSMWRPVEIGEKLWLAPEWLDETPPAGRLRLNMRPGLACGSGWHPCTQMCLEALERLIRPGDSVIDIGTGSGILADGARLLGAVRVAGCDIDPAATAVAHENLPGIDLFTGSARSVRDAAFAIVVANLNESTLRSVGPQLRRIAAKAVIVSGFREDEQEAVAKHIGTAPVRSLELDGWACLIG